MGIVETAMTGSISQAATKLKVSQPTLSRAIAGLELDLGYKIFIRPGSGKKAVLSDEGKLLLPRIKILLDNHKALSQYAMQLYHSSIPTSVAIGLPDYLPDTWVTKIANNIFKQWPDINLKLTQPGPFDCLRLLSMGELDFSIVIREEIPLQGIVFYDLSPILWALALPESIRAKYPNGISNEQLIQYRMAFPRGNVVGLSVLQESNYSFNCIEIEGFAEAVPLIKAEVAWSALPEWLMKKHQLKPIRQEHTNREYYEQNLQLAWKSSYQHQEMIELLVETVNSLAQE